METKGKTETEGGAVSAETLPSDAEAPGDAGKLHAQKGKRSAEAGKAHGRGAKEPEKSGASRKKAAGWPKLGGAKRKAARQKDKYKEEARALQDRLLRLQADFENFRKRTLREKTELYRNANEDILLELLPVLDHVALALDAAEKHGADPAFMEGFKLVAEQLRSALGKFGLKEIATEALPFDPNCHEAVSHLPSRDVEEGGIMAVARRGYMLGERRVLRAAQVVVSSGGPDGVSAEAPPERAADDVPAGGMSETEAVAEA